MLPLYQLYKFIVLVVIYVIRNEFLPPVFSGLFRKSTQVKLREAMHVNDWVIPKFRTSYMEKINLC